MVRAVKPWYGKRMEAIERFMRHTEEQGDCLVWTGATDKDGYGFFKARGPDGSWKQWRAHRWLYFHETGNDTPCVMHTCDNPPCVKRSHLVGGTVAENNADRSSKGRSNGFRGSGQDHPAAKMTDAQVAEARQLRAEGAKIRDLCARYGVTSDGYMSRLLNGFVRNDP